MARKKNKIVVLEDIELKPQVIGYTYKKKSNIGRVIFIFIIFILVIYYINDISVFINDLIGRNTANTIKDQTTNEDREKPSQNDDEEVVYNIFSDNLIINESGLTLNNFNSLNNILTFDANNVTNSPIDLSGRRFFIETYSENKTLLERFKVDFGRITANSKISFSINLNSKIYYLVLSEKNTNDYPMINLVTSDIGIATLTCVKDIESIVYSFKDNELSEITHTINDNNTIDTDYYNRYNSFQNKAVTYNNMDGITSTFNATFSGYTAVFAIDLQRANLSGIDEKYYYGYKEEPKVVNFEMETYGFNCN